MYRTSRVYPKDTLPHTPVFRIDSNVSVTSHWIFFQGLQIQNLRDKDRGRYERTASIYINYNIGTIHCRKVDVYTKKINAVRRHSV